MPNVKNTDPNRPLSPQQQTFVEYYTVDFNATQAAIKAGYAVKGAPSTAYRLLTYVHIQKAIQGELKKTSDRVGITKQKIINELASIGFQDPLDIYDYKKGILLFRDLESIPKEARASISSIETVYRASERGEEGETLLKVRFHSKQSALELIAKMEGFIVDRKQLSGPNGEPLETNYTIVMEYEDVKPGD